MLVILLERTVSLKYPTSKNLFIKNHRLLDKKELNIRAKMIRNLGQRCRWLFVTGRSTSVMLAR